MYTLPRYVIKHAKERMANQNNQDKLDLSSVNKNKKTKPAFEVVNPLKKQKGPLRDEEGKFTSGSGGLKKVQQINWMRAIPLIAVIAMVGGFFVYQSFAATNNPRTGVLRRIYAEQMIPKGYQSNQYLKQTVHTGTGTRNDGTGGRNITIVDPIWSQASGWWDNSWPEKIKVCAIVYQQLPQNETTVKLSVSASNIYQKTVILQKQKNLNPPNRWGKHEVCTGAISKNPVLPASAGRPALNLPPVNAYLIKMETVSVCAKEGQKLTMVSDERCYTNSFKSNDHVKYPPYVPYVEQYIIKAVSTR